MDLLSLTAVTVSGFTACSEFASFAFVHPVVRRLPTEHHLTVEKGLLETYGRVMPVLMPATGVLSVLHARRVRRPAAWVGVAFQAIRSPLLLAGSVLLSAASAGRSDGRR